MADDEQQGVTPPQPASIDAPPPSHAPLAITLQIVSPSVTDQTLRFHDLPAATTVREVKHRIRDALPSRPNDDQMRLIHRGRLLSRDTDTLLDIFGRDIIQSTDRQTLHLALRDLVSQPSATASASQRIPSGAGQAGEQRGPGNLPHHRPPPHFDAHRHHHHPHVHPGFVHHGMDPSYFWATHPPAGPLPPAPPPGAVWPHQVAHQQHAQHIAQHQNMYQWMDHLRHEATGAPRWAGQRDTLINHQAMRFPVPPAAGNNQNESHIMGYTVVAGGGAPANPGPPEAGANQDTPIDLSMEGNEAGRALFGIQDHDGAAIDAARASYARATQAMTDAMHRSASGASLANMATNLANTNLNSVQPIQPGVTTPLAGATPGGGTRSVTPDPSAQAAHASMPTSQPPQTSPPSTQTVPEMQLPQSAPAEQNQIPQLYMLHSPNGPVGVVANVPGEYRMAALIQAYPPVTLAFNPNVPHQIQPPADFQRQRAAGLFPQQAQLPRQPGQVVYLPHGYYYPPGYYPPLGTQPAAGNQRQPLVYYPQGYQLPPGYFVYGGQRPGVPFMAPHYGVNGQPLHLPPPHSQPLQPPAAGLHQPQGQAHQQHPRVAGNPLGAEGLRFRGHVGRAAVPAAPAAPAVPPAPVGGGIGHRGAPAVGWAVAGWTMMWHVIRFAGAIWWFSYSNPSWERWVLFGLCSLALLLVNLGWFNGMINNALQPIWRHLEGLIGVNGLDGQAHRQAAQNQQQQPQQQAQNQNQAQQEETPEARQRRLERPYERAFDGMVDPSPRDLGRRLVERRREAAAGDHGAWIRDRARFLERAAVLMVASLAPGVAERHIRQLEERERAERRAAEEAAEREQAAQEAAASQQAAENAENAENAEAEQPQTERPGADATEGSSGQANVGEGSAPVDGAAPVEGAAEQQDQQQPTGPALEGPLAV
ncbi:hypothetical protein QBC35DRAFT_470799 [Podospora australis]|uniref:DSC E3 ubiquitin ligase complex subunit 3 ubiquitin-like domain-containing protein n=1 Tax=Podospora australis TaxID=1536484 RepID=A0AAN6X4V1_9PEZI|nr:hypothetical protein QBC35DRAFT_470799 [Podospora australis]